MKIFTRYFLLSLLVIFASCQQNDLELEGPAGSLQNQEGYTLSIPDGFNFSTERKVRLNITDATPYVRYQVYGYSSTIGSEAQNISDAFNNLLYTGQPYNGSANFELSISNMYDKVYVSRNDGGESTFEIVDISNNNINISHRSLNTPSNTTKGNRGGSPAEIYYPGGTNQANIVFEDLWPSQGDYDFNDLVISYRIVFHLNIDGINVDSMDYIYDVTNIGAAYNNGFGIEFPFAANLYTVTGQRDSGSGGETSENGSVVRFFDNASLYLDTPQTLTITFTTAQDPSVIGATPYNPFLTENGDTNYEVHLAGQLYTGTTQPSTFPGFAPSFAKANNDVNGDYIVDAGVELNVPPLSDMEGMPWAINIAGTFVPPLPGEFIMKGHLKFLDWAQSGGVNFPDWFMDVSGYRDSNYLETIITPPLSAAIGDLREGGIVFWVDPTDNTKGKVCALSDAPTPLSVYNAIPYCNGFSNPDTGTGVYSDWYLPNKDELQLMYANLQRFGCSTNTPGGTDPSLCATRKGDFILGLVPFYWSSSEDNIGNGVVQDFVNGHQTLNQKNLIYSVRAVRAF